VPLSTGPAHGGAICCAAWGRIVHIPPLARANNGDLVWAMGSRHAASHAIADPGTSRSLYAWAITARLPASWLRARQITSMSMARRVGEIVRAPTAEPLRVPESVEYAFWA